MDILTLIKTLCDTRLSLELQKANFLKCEVRSCMNRKLPTGY